MTARDRAAILACVNSDLAIEGCDLSATRWSPCWRQASLPAWSRFCRGGDRLRIERNRIQVASAAAGRTATGGIHIGGGSTGRGDPPQ